MTVVGIVALGLYLGASRVVLQSFGRLETQQIVENLDRAERAWESSYTRIAALARDYARWDDTCNFVVDRNQAYIEENLAGEGVVNLDLNFSAVVNSTRTIIAAKAVDLSSGETIPLRGGVLL